MPRRWIPNAQTERPPRRNVKPQSGSCSQSAEAVLAAGGPRQADALPKSGAYAEFVCLPQSELVPVPSGLDAATFRLCHLSLVLFQATRVVHRMGTVRRRRERPYRVWLRTSYPPSAHAVGASVAALHKPCR